MKLSVQERLARNKLFEGIDPDFLSELVRIPEVVTVAQDEVIFAEGDGPDYLYLIISGSVQISKQAREGKQETLVYLGQDDYFGDLAMYDPAPRSTRATAAQDTELGRIDQPGWDLLLELAGPEVIRNLLVTGARRLRRADTDWIERLLRAERLSLLGSVMSTVVHDLKDPMNVIMGAADTIQMRTEDPEVKRLTGLIFKYLDRMSALARDVTEFSRGESNLEARNVSVLQLMSELDELILNRLAERRVAVELQLAYTGDTWIDPDKFLRVLLNLTKNAIEAMPDGGTLRISTQEAENNVVFTVSDTGKGIPKEILPTVFEPFVTRGKRAGTGLGLAITKSIVEAHGGAIFVSSTLDRGTTFEIVLPRTDASSARNAESNAHPS